jgi:hypothetical protein
MLPASLVQQARNVDLLALLRNSPLRRVSTQAGGEYQGPCPLCGGSKRFHVQPGRGRWFCRHCTQGRWLDAIALEMRRESYTFEEAVNSLVGAQLPALVAPPPATLQAESEPPNEDWQAQAQQLVTQAEAALWSNAGRAARHYLHARGLQEATLRHWRIGFLPRPQRVPAAAWGLSGDPLYVAAGILLPGLIAQTAWFLKIRRLAPHADPKYLAVRGGHPALFGTLGTGPVCATEGEFDTLLLWQELQRDADLQHLGVVTLGSQTNRLTARWARCLQRRRLLVCLDQDPPGEIGAADWHMRHDLSQRVYWPVGVAWPNHYPAGKDLTDYFLTGGDLRSLIRYALGQILPGKYRVLA